jgi:hypothetical protein
MPTDHKRTKTIHIYTPRAQSYRVEILRELIRTYENGDSLSIPSGERRVQREFATLAPLQLPTGPVTISTYADLADVLSACGNALGAEDEQYEAELLSSQQMPPPSPPSS